jgi:hypothetical protein
MTIDASYYGFLRHKAIKSSDPDFFSINSLTPSIFTIERIALINALPTGKFRQPCKANGLPYRGAQNPVDEPPLGRSCCFRYPAMSI